MILLGRIHHFPYFLIYHKDSPSCMWKSLCRLCQWVVNLFCIFCCIIDLINSIHRLLLDSAGCLHVPAAGEVSSESGVVNDCKTTGVKLNICTSWSVMTLFCMLGRTCAVRRKLPAGVPMWWDGKLLLTARSVLQGIVWPTVVSGAAGNILNVIINYILLTHLDLGVA